MISRQEYVTAMTDVAAAAPDAHPETFAPHANATMPARASTQAEPAARLTQIRGFTTRAVVVGAYGIDACVIRDAATAAPNPLSMLTTVTPAAQLFSAARRARSEERRVGKEL